MSTFLVYLQKEANDSLNAINYINDSNKLKQNLEELDKINKKMTELFKERSRAINRKLQNEKVLKELESLNKTLKVGTLTCKDCGSNNVEYSTSNKDFSFDISSKEIRSQIRDTIKNRIEIYEEEISSLTSQIYNEQNKIKDLLKTNEIKISDLILFKDDILKASEDDEYAKNLDRMLKNLEYQIKQLDSSVNSNSEKAKQFINDIIEEMNIIYNKIDPDSNVKFDSIFPKKNKIYSGSESTVYYLSKLISLFYNLEHNFPIVIDEFRAEELSTQKEQIVLSIFKDFVNQIILTATLKKEELEKYDNISWINSIDYSNFQSNKLLQPSYLDEFKKLFKHVTMSVI